MQLFLTNPYPKDVNIFWCSKKKLLLKLFLLCKKCIQITSSYISCRSIFAHSPWHFSFPNFWQFFLWLFPDLKDQMKKYSIDNDCCKTRKLSSEKCNSMAQFGFFTTILIRTVITGRGQVSCELRQGLFLKWQQEPWSAIFMTSVGIVELLNSVTTLSQITPVYSPCHQISTIFVT